MSTSSLRVSTVKWASSFSKAGMIVLLLQVTTAAAYDFNLSGASGDAEYGSRIYTSADYYQSHDINPDQYASDLLSALGSPNTDNHSFALGLGNAMAEALERGNYRAFNYECLGATAFDPSPNGGEGPRGAGYCYDGISQAASHGVNTTSATDAAFEAGTAIDRKFGSYTADQYPRANQFGTQSSKR